MTSHYIRCSVEGLFEAVFDALDEAFGNIYSKKLANSSDKAAGVILGEQYFFRVNSDVAVLITLEKRTSNATQIEIVSCAGGAGMLSISYSSHSSYVQDVKNFLVNRGFTFTIEEEISYFGKSYGQE